MTTTKTKQMLMVIFLLVGLLPAEVTDRKLVTHPDPEYPVLAQRNGIHGSVKLKIWISSSGEVRRLEYIGGHPVLAEAALKAVKTWKYEPGKDEQTTIVEVKF